MRSLWLVTVLFCSYQISFAKSESKSSAAKIYAIHSYEADFPWTQILMDAFEEELKKSKVSYSVQHRFYEIKKNPWVDIKEHPLTSKFLDEIKKIKPDVVLLSDDSALNEMAKSLADLKIPFVFSGINGDLPQVLLDHPFKKYTGVFERYYIQDSLKLLKRVLSKKSLKVLVMLEDSEVGEIVKKFYQQESKKISGIQSDIVVSSDWELWKSKLSKKPILYDAVLPLQFYALKDSNEKTVPGPDVVHWIYQNLPLATVYTGGWHVRCGGTMSIAIRPNNQGQYAAKFVKKIILNKVPLSKPFTPPHGDIELNNDSAEKIGIKIPFDLLTTATIYKKTQEPCLP